MWETKVTEYRNFEVQNLSLLLFKLIVKVGVNSFTKIKYMLTNFF